MRESTRRIIASYNQNSVFDNANLAGIGSGSGFGFDLSPYSYMAILPNYWRTDHYQPDATKGDTKELLFVLAVGIRSTGLEAFELPVWAVRRRGARRQDTARFEDSYEGYRTLMACKDDLARLQFLDGAVWKVAVGEAFLSSPLKGKETEDDRRTFKVSRFAVVDKKVDDASIVQKFVEFLTQEGLVHTLPTGKAK